MFRMTSFIFRAQGLHLVKQNCEKLYRLQLITNTVLVNVFQLMKSKTVLLCICYKLTLSVRQPNTAQTKKIRTGNEHGSASNMILTYLMEGLTSILSTTHTPTNQQDTEKKLKISVLQCFKLG